MPKILVLMSGGVDSSVAAYLLREQGHDVTGLTLKLFEATDSKTPGCCGAPQDIYDAKECARILGIPHYTLDEIETFSRQVIKDFRESYLKGQTPNPCVECNRSLKFGKILSLARSWGFDAIATGHYARITHHASRITLCKARDSQKDQSYFLYMLKAQDLPNILFPLAGVTKKETRAIAQKAGLPTAKKEESQEICFVSAAGGDYRKIIGCEDGVGEIRDTKTGKVLGQHSGHFNFTIGQREGLGVALGSPRYVIAIDAKTKTVFIGENEDLMKSQIEVTDVSWIHEDYAKRSHTQVKIRYRSPEVGAQPQFLGVDHWKILFDELQRAPTPGQFAVFYDDDIVLGGGKIARV